LTLLAILVASVFIFINPILDKKIKEKLQTYINTSAARPYDYDYAAINVQVLRGNIWLTGVRIDPRDGITDRVNAGKSSFYIEASTDSVAITGLSVYQLLVKGNICIDKILVSDVHFRYLYNGAYTNPDTAARKPFVLKDIFSDKLAVVSIGCFELRNINVYTDDVYTADTVMMRFDKGNMIWRDIYTDKEVMAGRQPFTYSDLQVSAEHFETHMIKEHVIQVDSFSLSTAASRIELHGVEFAPVNFDFSSKSKQFIRSVNAISAADLVLTGVNFKDWQEHGRLDIRKVYAHKPVVKVGMDHRWPKPMYERVFLSSRVRSIPLPVKIDTITADDGYIFYREIFADGKPPLVITFNDASVDVYNVCNDPKVLEAHPELVFKASAKLLDAGRLNVNVVFRIPDSLNSFHAVITIGAMPLETFNTILEDQMSARLYGQMNTLAMNFDANKFGSHGDFVFDYNGLKLQFFKEKQTSKGMKEKKNWLVNTLVNPILRTDNNRSQPNFKSGMIDYKRPLDISFFGLVWQSIKSGMVSTLVPGKGEKAEARRQAKAEKKAEKRKDK